MRSQSYARSNEDSCLYTKKCIDDSSVILILYVDDMLIAGKNNPETRRAEKKIYISFFLSLLVGLVVFCM